MIAEGNLHVTTSLCEKAAKIQVSFDPSDWLKIPPRVFAMVDWLQPRGSTDWESCSEWHRYSSGELCWTRPDCWHAMIAEEPENIDRMAASLVKDVTVLLGCHLLADRLGIMKWQPQWQYWSHGSYKGG